MMRVPPDPNIVGSLHAFRAATFRLLARYGSDEHFSGAVGVEIAISEAYPDLASGAWWRSPTPGTLTIESVGAGLYEVGLNWTQVTDNSGRNHYPPLRGGMRGMFPASKLLAVMDRIARRLVRRCDWLPNRFGFDHPPRVGQGGLDYWIAKETADDLKASAANHDAVQV